LTKPDTVRITVPPLSRETMEKVLELIRHDVAADRIKIDNPSQNLESYFLQVVRQAQESATETSGALAGSTVAAYLRGEAASEVAPDKILERLTLPSAPPEPKEKSPVPASPLVDEQKLAALGKPAPPAAAAPAGADAAAGPQEKGRPVPAEELAKANEKLSALLGKKP
jgi:hypothetical protein